MLQWIRLEASKLRFGVVIRRSGNGSNKSCTFVIMSCERSGKYIPPLRNFKRNDIDSRKCECPFKVCGYMLANNKWRFNVICGLHNHDLYEKLADHPIACCLMPEEKKCVTDIILNLIQSKNILSALQRNRPENISNIKQVYNIRYQTNKALREDKIEMQQLLKLLDANNYVCRYRTCDDGVTVRDIFWTHPDSIKLFNTFSTVLILNSTFKTNKYRLPLLEMIGVTSYEKTYSVGFTFLESEKEDNATLVLQVCRTILKDKKKIHKMIVTNRDTVLINSIAKVFPTSYAFVKQ
ncbi:protein FAR1-RELATED SEQUENCE 5 isoform X2 [Lathyrus oleraceus]|nr:protein FAR1-RELATED SEQUENCE 5-like isoform X2 [Pisum sativum]